MFGESNQEKKSEFSLEIVSGFNEKYLNTIIDLEKKCFPEEWQYDDVEGYYKKMLKDERNISIFLKNNDVFVGYVLAKPHNEAVKELKEIDPELEFEDQKYYIETIQIVPEARGCKGAKKLLIAICEEGIKKGIVKFSIHARTLNGFSEKVKKIFEGKVLVSRKIKKWKPANGEPYEYIEWFF